MTVLPLKRNSVAASPKFNLKFEKGIPFFGEMLNYARDPLAYMVRMHTAGDFVASKALNMIFYQLNHPDLIEEALVTQNQHFRKDKGLREMGRPVFGNGLLTSDGDFWLRQRRLASPAFHRQRIAAYGEVMVNYTNRMAQTWRDGEVRDTHEDMMHLTLEVVAKCLFNTEAMEQAKEIGRALDAIMAKWNNQGPGQMIEGMLGRPLPNQTHRNYVAGIKQLDETIYGIINERRSPSDGTQHDAGDLLSMFLEARDEDGSAMSDQQLRDECMTMFIAGHETTALALSWTWYELSQQPAIVAKLQDELKRVLNGRLPTLSDLPQLIYTGHIITETMRLWPPAWAISREAVRDVEIGGHVIPKGSEVVMSQYAMHRDARYFAQPEQFKPERWENDFAKTLPKYAYFPFGGGPRLCIGQQFAQMEAVLMLATMAQKFTFELLPNQRIKPQPSITMRPKYGLKMVLRAL
jgi:cytochrome P450